MTSEGIDLVSAFSGDLPTWADPRLIVHLKRESPSQLCVVAGNPHTFRGLISLFDLQTRQSLSARPSQIVPATAFAEGWLAGYLTGNEPAPAPDHLYLSSRIARERDFFHLYERELPPERAGRVAVNLAVLGDGILTVAEFYTNLAVMMCMIADRLPTWRTLTWTPNSDYVPLAPLRLTTPEEVEAAFDLLNAGYEVDSGIDWLRSITVVSTGNDGITTGAYEIRVEINNDGPLLDKGAVTINIESLAAIDPAATTQAHVWEAVRRLFLSATAGLGASIGSVATGESLLHADGYLVENNETSAVAIPGWLNHVAGSIGSSQVSALESAGYSITEQRNPRSMLVEYRDGPTVLSVSDATLLASILDETTLT